MEDEFWKTKLMQPQPQLGNWNLASRLHSAAKQKRKKKESLIDINGVSNSVNVHVKINPKLHPILFGNA